MKRINKGYKMVVTETSLQELLVILEDCFRHGIRNIRPEWYKASKGYINAFIDPYKHSIEVYASADLMLGLYFRDDNNTWDSFSMKKSIDNRVVDIYRVYNKVRRERSVRYKNERKLYE